MSYRLVVALLMLCGNVLALDLCADVDRMRGALQAAISQPPPGLPELTTIMNLNCDTADINGLADTPQFAPNAIPDRFEFAMINALVNSPALDLSAGTLQGQKTPGVNAGDVVSAFNLNLQRAQDATVIESLIAMPPIDLNSDIGRYFYVISAYATMGDAGSVSATYLLLLKHSFPMSWPGAAAPWDTHLAQFLSADGDADGDGATNREEYLAYGGGGVEAYVSAALDPRIVPTVALQPMVIGAAFTGLHKPLHLHASTPRGAPTSYQWAKDGNDIPGAAGVDFHIDSAAAADSGDYVVKVSYTPAKALYISAPVHVQVASAVPAAAPMGLVALAVVLSCAGSLRLLSARRTAAAAGNLARR